jgi:hypothetical protein
MKVAPTLVCASPRRSIYCTHNAYASAAAVLKQPDETSGNQSVLGETVRKPSLLHVFHPSAKEASSGEGETISAVSELPQRIPYAVPAGLMYAPEFRHSLILVPVGDEGILFDEKTGDMHRLDRIAQAVCSLFDGQRPLGEIVSEMVRAFGAETAVVERDLLEMVRNLGASGLLKGIPDSLPIGAETDSAETNYEC